MSLDLLTANQIRWRKQKQGNERQEKEIERERKRESNFRGELVLLEFLFEISRLEKVGTVDKSVQKICLKVN